MTERKTLELADVKVDDSGSFSGYANVFNNIDSGGDRVLPGSFNDAIPQFLKDGFISWNHNWGMPVAMPTEAYEDQKGLFVAAKFHTTPEAQSARTITAERIAAGKSMGLSIGYEADKVKAQPYGRDLEHFSRIYETGLVMVPMNGLSSVTAIKGSLGSGLPYAERLELVLAELKALAEHSRERAELRQKEGRVLSNTNRDRLASLKESLATVLSDIDELLQSTDPTRNEAAAKAALARAIVTLASV